MLRRMIGPVALLLCVGCLQPSVIASNRDSDYKDFPKRIYAITDVGSEFSPEFYNKFTAKFTSIAKASNIEVLMNPISNLDLDDKTHITRMKDFSADTFLSIRRIGGTRSAYGDIIRAAYDVKMFDAKTEKRVWRANIQLYPEGLRSIESKGDGLAIDITNQMKEDKVLEGDKLPVYTPY